MGRRVILQYVQKIQRLNFPRSRDVAQVKLEASPVTIQLYEASLARAKAMKLTRVPAVAFSPPNIAGFSPFTSSIMQIGVWPVITAGVCPPNHCSSEFSI